MLHGVKYGLLFSIFLLRWDCSSTSYGLVLAPIGHRGSFTGWTDYT